jgi:hypothetical protein
MNPIQQAIFDTIKEALENNDGNRLLACKELEINSRSLYNYMNRMPELKEYVRPKIQYGNDKWRRFPDE